MGLVSWLHPWDILLAYCNNQFGEGNGSPLQYSCLENPRDGGAWWTAVYAVTQSRTQLSHFTFTFHFHVLEKEMASHSSVLAWRIPGTAEPGGLPSMGSQSWTRLKWLSSSSNNQLKKYVAPFSKTSKEGTLRPPSDFYVRIFLCPFLYFDKTLLHKSSWVIKPGPWSQSCIFFGDHKSNIVHCKLSPGGASGKESTCQCRRQKRREFSLWVGKIPWRGARQLTLLFSSGKLHGQRSLAGCCPWGCKELDATVVTQHACQSKISIAMLIKKSTDHLVKRCPDEHRY